MQKHLHTSFALACVACLTPLNAQSAPVTKYVAALENWTASSASFTWSEQAIAAINLTEAAVSTLNLAKQASLSTPLNEAKYTSIIHNLPLTSFTYDDVDGQVLSATFTGDIQLVTKPPKHLTTIDGGLIPVEGPINTTGGRIFIGSLHVDFQTQKVFSYGSVGAEFWTFTGASSRVTEDGGLLMNIPNLSFTEQGFSILSGGGGLGLVNDGRTVWSQVASVGSFTSAVPETGTHGLMLLGFAGLTAALRRLKLR